MNGLYMQNFETFLMLDVEIRWIGVDARRRGEERNNLEKIGKYPIPSCESIFIPTII